MIDDRIDTSQIQATLFDQADLDDLDFWLSKTPSERVEGIEYLRRWLYGDAAVDARLQRVLDLVELDRG